MLHRQSTSEDIFSVSDQVESDNFDLKINKKYKHGSNLHTASMWLSVGSLDLSECTTATQPII